MPIFKQRIMKVLKEMGPESVLSITLIMISYKVEQWFWIPNVI